MSYRMRPEIEAWRYAWGTPLSTFMPVNKRKMEAAFLLAIFLHALPFGYLWNKRVKTTISDTVSLQNVDLIEPEPIRPIVTPPPPQKVEQPKSAFDFLKMALPKFRKKAPPIEAPREIKTIVKKEAPKIAEPKKLIEKKMPAQPPVPKINLNKNSGAPPKIAEIARVVKPNLARTPVSQEPSLKLEEVGTKAVVPKVAAPAIDLNRRSNTAPVDIAAIPKKSMVPRNTGASERLVERSGSPKTYKKPPPVAIGYKRRGGSSIALDRPRSAVPTPKPEVVRSIPKSRPKDDVIKISKDSVNITGPLSQRKVLRSSVPQYPDWARARNIEASVAIRFTVSSDGRVLDNAVVERTSGYVELDKLALLELQKWRFSPLSGAAQNQWGVITFRFILN